MPQNRRSYEKTRRIALSGLLFALAMALSFIEGTLTIPGLLPGMKLGLANIVVMYALFFMGPRQALVLDVLKALFVFLVSGFTAGFLSLCGGLAVTFGDVGAVLSAAGAAHLVHPVRMRRTGPQHRPAAGCRRDHLVLALVLLCAGHAGAGPCDGRTDLHHPQGPAAGSWQNGLLHAGKAGGITNRPCITVAFWPEISIIRKQPAILKIKSLAYSAAAVGKCAAAGRCLHYE